MKASKPKPRAGQRSRLAIVINTVAPYRLPIYAALAESFETTVLHGGNEANRTWKLALPEHLKVQEVYTVQVPVKRRTGVRHVSDTTYFHLNVGLLWSLPRLRPDVIISNELGLRTIVCMLYAWLFRVPHWVWWGGTLHSERCISGFKKRARLLLSRRIDRWISYGSSSTEYLRSIGVACEEILQIQNCVPHETFLVDPPGSPRWFHDLPKPVLLTVGQLIARKGMDRLIDACGRVASKGHQFSLVIVGRGPEQAALAERAASGGLDHLLILPNQDQPTLNEMYRSAHVFVFPTLEDVWGLVASEAMWAGLPLLCSQYAGCAGEIVSGTNVFDPLSNEEFDHAIERAIRGELPPADYSRLLTWQEVSAVIVRSLQIGIPQR